MRLHIFGGLVAATTAAVLLAGCSNSSSAPAGTSAAAAPSPTASVSAEHNSADVAFAQGMIPHHEQAIAMSSQAATRAASQEVKDLATRIGEGQGPELEQMTRMLQAWGAPRPQPGASSMPGMPGMAMGAVPMQGMMSNDQMQQLAAQSGPTFDRAFLQMMMQHHAGAIQMARIEQAQGLNPQAKELAGAIITAQQQEITEMQALLSRV